MKTLKNPIRQPPDASFEIVGVVGDVKNVGPQQPAKPMAFIPNTTNGSFMLPLKTTVEPASQVHTVEEQVWAVGPDEIVGIYDPLEDFLQRGVRALTAGLRFSHDVGNGGSLFATLIAKDLLVNHLRAVADALHLETDPLRGPLSAAQRSRLQEAVAQLGDGLDWRTAAKRDLEALRVHYAADAQTSAALGRIISSYVAALDDASKLPTLNEAIDSAPQQLANVIPNAKRVLEQKQDFNNRLLQTRSLLQ